MMRSRCPAFAMRACEAKAAPLPRQGRCVHATQQMAPAASTSSSVPHRQEPRRTLFAVLGLALLATAIAANQAWLDRHFLPSFLMPRHWYVRLETTVRVCIAVFGVSLVLTRQRLARYVDRRAGRAGSILLAGVLGLGASEWFLGRVHLRPTEWLLPEEEPRRRVDPRLGWVLEPARVGRTRAGGRAIEYAIDPSGYRVRRVDEPVDPLRPTVLFTGESVMFGEGLGSDETIPEQAGMMLGVQPANLAVHGYSTDQAYLRLVTELPRFQRPVAVVTLFMTALLGRNLDDDRPHLGPDLVWRPAVPNSRLAALAGFLVPFRKDKTVDDGVRTT